jgi:large subunit ribosomal protein L31e
VSRTLTARVRSRSTKQVPKRIRVQIQRKHNDSKDAEEDLYSYVTVVDTPNGFKGLGTNVIDHE